MEDMNNGAEINVLVTGFGQFLDIKTNPSHSITTLLPSHLNFPTLCHTICIIVPPQPLKAAYHSLLAEVPPLLEKYNPDYVIHIGLAAGRDYFAIEKGAERDGYHEFPDEERKVVTRAEVKKLWGKSPARLDSAIDFEDVVERWRSIVKGGAGHAKAKGHGKDKEKEKDSEVKGSDDVGNYVCGFVYYVSLEWLWERKKEGKVLFLHVPNLVTEKEVERGRDITLALIKAVVESGTN